MVISKKVSLGGSGNFYFSTLEPYFSKGCTPNWANFFPPTFQINSKITVDFKKHFKNIKLHYIMFGPNFRISHEKILSSRNPAIYYICHSPRVLV